MEEASRSRSIPNWIALALNKSIPDMITTIKINYTTGACVDVQLCKMTSNTKHLTLSTMKRMISVVFKIAKEVFIIWYLVKCTSAKDPIRGKSRGANPTVKLTIKCKKWNNCNC